MTYTLLGAMSRTDRSHRATLVRCEGISSNVIPPSEAGFTFVALMVAVVLMNIALGVAMTSWITIDRRSDEAEAIWRGQQYMRALECFQVNTGGALPRQLEELVESNCIRRLWGDPLVRKGRWVVLRTADLFRIQQEALEQQKEKSDESNGGSPFIREGGQSRRGTSTLSGMLDTQHPVSGEQVAGFLLGSGRRAGSMLAPRQGERTVAGHDNSSLDAIVGVMSSRKGDALRSYRGKLKYEKWLFVIGP